MKQFQLIFGRLPSGRSSLQQAPGERSPYRFLLDAVQAALEGGAIAAREGLGLEEIAYGVWALVHGMATLQQSHLRQHDADFAAIDRHVLEAFVGRPPCSRGWAGGRTWRGSTRPEKP